MRFRPFNLIICLTAVLLPVVVGTTGCRSNASRADQPNWARQLADLEYPKDANYGEDLDIRATKQGAVLVLVSREPKSYENVQLWLNRQYVSVIERVDVAQQIDAPFAYFINEYGESFPVGWLLAPEEARPVLSAEVYDPGTGLKHRLVAVTEKDALGN